MKRASKKQVRNLYKDEGVRQIQVTGRKQEIDHVSVFKY